MAIHLNLVKKKINTVKFIQRTVFFLFVFYVSHPMQPNLVLLIVLLDGFLLGVTIYIHHHIV